MSQSPFGRCPLFLASLLFLGMSPGLGSRPAKASSNAESPGENPGEAGVEPDDPATAWAVDPETGAPVDAWELSLEELLDLRVEVITSGREKQKLSQVPESIWVLSSEEIRRSGATNIAELLRLVPGMDAVQLSPGHYEVFARDHENNLSHRMLVLIDSKPVYMNFFKIILWHSLPVIIEEIDRIEVMLGPGSTLYGTNAMKATINIITRQPDKNHLLVRVLAGPQLNEGLSVGSSTKWNNFYAGATYAHTFDKFSLRASLSYLENPPWEDGTYAPGYQKSRGLTDPEDYRHFRTTRAGTFSLLLRWQPNPDTTLLLRNGVNRSETDYIPFRRHPMDYTNYLGELQYQRRSLFLEDDQLEASLYYRFGDLDTGFILQKDFLPAIFQIQENVLNLSAMYRFGLGMFTTTFGGEVELQRYDSTFLLPEAESLDYASLFLQERFDPFEMLSLQAVLRLEHQILPDRQRTFLYPKGSVVFTPHRDHVVRFSIGQAFQSPALIEAYSNVVLQGDTTPTLGGNIDLTNSTITMLDLGYQYTIPKLLNLKASVYYGWIDDNMFLTINQNAPPQFWIENDPTKITLLGTEIGGTIRPLSWLGIKAAYAYSTESREGLADVYGAPRTPEHKFYLTVWSRLFDRLDINLDLIWMTGYARSSELLQPGAINPVELLNARIAYAVMDQLNLVLTGYNLLNLEWKDKFYNQGIDVEHQGFSSERIGRRIMLGLEFRL